MGGSAQVKDKKKAHMISYSKSSLSFVTTCNSMAKALFY